MQMMLAKIVTAMLLITLGAVISDEATLHAQETMSYVIPSKGMVKPEVTPTRVVNAPEEVSPPIKTSIGTKDVRFLTSVKQSDLECLAKNVYFEARGEGRIGMLAVAFVTMNRVEHEDEWPSTVCGVVYQRTQSGCQFVWTCNRYPVVRDQEMWRRSLDIAQEVMTKQTLGDPTHNAVFFHAGTPSMRPSPRAVYTVSIGGHSFFRLKS